MFPVLLLPQAVVWSLLHASLLYHYHFLSCTLAFPTCCSAACLISTLSSQPFLILDAIWVLLHCLFDWKAPDKVVEIIFKRLSRLPLARQNATIIFRIILNSALPFRIIRKIFAVNILKPKNRLSHRLLHCYLQQGTESLLKTGSIIARG